MDWLYQLFGITTDETLGVSIPKGKIIAHIRTTCAQKDFARELDNIEDVVYHAIFRERISAKSVDELHVIEVVLSEPKYVKAIAEAFRQAIPYPKIIIFSSGEKYLLFSEYAVGEPVSRYNFSEWVYEEELLVDFELGSERRTAPEKDTEDEETWWDLPSIMHELFDEAAGSEWICLRHLIDILKIREAKSGRKYVRPMLAELVVSDSIAYLVDSPFVLRNEADELYLKRNPQLLSCGSIEDGRFGVDRQFEPLTKCELTSFSEMHDLLNKAADGVGSYSGYEWREDDEFGVFDVSEGYV